jgi:hypothetical protein
VPRQVETGNARNCRLGIHPRARLALGDYTATLMCSLLGINRLKYGYYLLTAERS